MAISAPAVSTQAALYTAVPPAFVPSRDHGKLRRMYFDLTFTAAGFTTASAGDIELGRLPAGKVRVYAHTSRLICPAGTSTADLDLGYAAYTNAAGTAVVADGDAIAASVDVGGGAIDQDLDDIADVFEFESRSGIKIVCSFDTANSPASGVLRGWLDYTVGG